MTSHWTIGKRLLAAFAAVLAVPFAEKVVSYQHILVVKQATAAITLDSLPGIYQIGQVQTVAGNWYALALEHLGTSGSGEMAALELQMRSLQEDTERHFTEYEKTITHVEDREIYNGIQGPYREFKRALEEGVLPLSRAGKKEEARAAAAALLEPAHKRYLESLIASCDYNKTLGDRNAAYITDAVSASAWAMLIGGLLNAMVGGGTAFWILRSTNGLLRTSTKELREGAEQVTMAASEVSRSAQSLSQGATEQAASLEQTSASMEEMASMTRKNAENCERVAALTNEVDSRVAESSQFLGEMVTSMASLKESSAKVSRIIKTIDEIAFQTNILALNAAVEAARAGEAGMGFAVVADEVRGLAQRSAQAAKDTAALIEESVVRSNEGGEKVDHVSSSIAAIAESVDKVKGLVEEVSLASRQQAQGIDQVSRAVAEMEKVTQGTAATAEQSAAASEELSAQAETSMEVIRRLSAMVGATEPALGVVRPARGKGSNGAHPARGGLPKGAARRRTAEEEIPLEDTGSYGSF